MRVHFVMHGAQATTVVCTTAVNLVYHGDTVLNLASTAVVLVPLGSTKFVFKSGNIRTA